MTFLQLEYFYAVAISGSISRTAERYNISPAALSRSISQLERELGVELFSHEGRSIALNESGRIFLQCAEEIFESMSTARQRISYAQKHHVVRVRLEAFVGDTGELPIAFRIARPDIIVEILPGKNSSERYDLRIFESSSVMSGPSVELLCDERYVAALPATHQLANRAAIDLSELREDAFAICRNGRHEYAVVQMCREAGFSPHVNLTFDVAAYRGVFRAIEEGLSVSLVPELASHSYWHRDKVALVPLSNILRTRRIYASSADGGPIDENCMFVCDTIRQRLQNADIAR